MTLNSWNSLWKTFGRKEHEGLEKKNTNVQKEKMIVDSKSKLKIIKFLQLRYCVMWMVEIHNWSTKRITGPTSEFVGTENLDKNIRASESRITNLGRGGCTVFEAQLNKQLKEIKKNSLKWVITINKTRVKKGMWCRSKGLRGRLQHRERWIYWSCWYLRLEIIEEAN